MLSENGLLSNISAFISMLPTDGSLVYTGTVPNTAEPNDHGRRPARCPPSMLYPSASDPDCPLPFNLFPSLSASLLEPGSSSKFQKVPVDLSVCTMKNTPLPPRPV